MKKQDQKQKKWQKKIFRYFFICYLIVFLLPGIALGVYFGKMQRIMEDDIAYSYQMQLEQSAFLADNWLLELSNTLHKANQLLSRFYQEHGSDLTAYEYYELQNQISALNILDGNLVVDYCILDNIRNIALFSDGVSSQQSLAEREGLQAIDWETFQTGHYYQNLSRSQQHGLMFYSSFPVGKSGIPDFQIILFLNPFRLQAVFLDESTGTEPMVFLITSGNDLLFQGEIGFTEDIPDTTDVQAWLQQTEYTAFSQNSSIQGITYRLLIPSEVFSTSRKTIYGALWLFYGGSILIVMGFLIYFSFKRTKPLRELVELLDGWNNSMTGKVYYELEQGVTSLLVGYRDAARILQERRPLLRSAVFRTICQGKFLKGRDIGSQLIYYGIAFPADSYILLLCQLGGSLETDFRLDYGKENLEFGKAAVIVEQCFAVCGEIIPLDEKRMAALLCFREKYDNGGNLELCRQAAGVAFQEGEKNIGTKLLFGFSKSFDSLEDLPQLYRQALDVLEHNVMREQNDALQCEELQSSGKHYEYSLEEEEQLINFTLSGNYKGVHALLKEIYTHNIVDNDLSAETLNAMAEALCLTVKRVTQKTKCSNMVKTEIDRLDYKRPLPEIFGMINECFRLICENGYDGEEGRTAQLVEQAVDFIALHLSDSGLNGTLVANQLGVAEKYLTSCFKEVHYMTIGTYIEKERIRFACDLLANSEVPITEIAEKAGYNNDRSFRRAFKRLIGLNPTDYKQAQSRRREK